MVTDSVSPALVSAEARPAAAISAAAPIQIVFMIVPLPGGYRTAPRPRAPGITLRQVFGETQRELGSWGRLLTCAAVGYRRCPVQSWGVPSGSGRLTIGRSLASCTTSESRPHSPSSAKIGRAHVWTPV